MALLTISLLLQCAINIYCLNGHLIFALFTQSVLEFIDAESTVVHYYEGSDFCCSLPSATGLPASCVQPSHHSNSNHSMQSEDRYYQFASKVFSRLRHGIEGSSLHKTESSSSSFGLMIRFQLLSTLPHGNAVTFNFRITGLP